MLNLYLFILLPPVIAGVLHMFVVKANLWAGLSVPIHIKSFGANKTWRGIVVVSLANALATLAVNPFTLHYDFATAFWLGLVLGVTYMLAELPNSWFKRRRGIKPGRRAEKYPGLYKLLDKVDSAAGLAVASFFLFQLTVWQALLLFAVASAVHALFSALLVAVSVKKSF